MQHYSNRCSIYSAINPFDRLLSVTTPDTAITTYSYNKNGLLFTVRVDDVHSLETDIINEIYYNAKGQRLKTKYENGATTTYEYDANIFRVTRNQWVL